MSENTQPQQEVLIVTGMSGAGRSTAANSLEDLGWYVVDNLPPQMLKPLIELAEHAAGGLPRIAAVVDIRGRELFHDFQEILAGLGDAITVRILFLDAADNILIKRYEQVRRPHPLQGDGTLLDGISAERERLGELRANSDIVIDTSDLNVHQLARTVNELFSESHRPGVKVTVLSFGFKYGIPVDADLVADARFLPNPFWIPELKHHNGLEEQVSDYVLGQERAGQFLESYTALLDTVFAGYMQENKHHVTVAIGCTGGKHRSVAMVEELAKRLSQDPNLAVSVRHRDLGRE